MKAPPFDAIYSRENLALAWHKVSLGKTKTTAVIDFYRNLDANLASIARDLRSGAYQPGPYKQFLIKDPKERIISAASIRDRVVQHAIMNCYDPVFDRYQLFDSYACRRNKGTQKAVLRAFHFAKSSPYFLKMDVRHYFNSIDHAVLKGFLRRLIKVPLVERLLGTIIDASVEREEKGVPIGNLTSQYFANHYLAVFDHYLKERHGVKKYLRYMDDMLVFTDDKAALKTLYTVAESFNQDTLRLTLKPSMSGSTDDDGAPFLGFLIKRHGIYLQRKSKRRYIARLAEIEHHRLHGLFSEVEVGKRIESVTAHLLLARSRDFRNTVLHGRFIGLEPCVARRELEP
ncbi:MAG: reverse transcriptase/maturase family protein [Treponema sp.]|jgi:retron-type reverse transcriptase|nr:reverse transcriptase/maturase family protein [Treponema sp.]